MKPVSRVSNQTGAIYIAIETGAEYTEYINQTGAIYIATETVAEYTCFFFAEQFMWREISLAGQRAGLGVFF